MAATDPSYPLYLIACLLASAMLLLVLLTSFIRQSWNLGVVFLCFWLFWENLADGIGSIVWADNADIKLYIYCDIVSHLQQITSVVKPMATLIITRRLYLITSLRSIEPPTKAARHRNLAIEWALGLGIPLLVAGPFYYIVQGARFEVKEGVGCTNAPESSMLSILLLNSWNVLPPLVSITVYYPHVARVFYRHNREINQFLQSNNPVSRTNYFRILALACIDILLTLPMGIVTIVLLVKNDLSFGRFPFYYGWTPDHTDWQPVNYSYADITSGGPFDVAYFHFTNWTSPVLAFAIFGLFGVTLEARASYWRVICTVCGWFGWQPTPRAHRARSPLGDIEFGGRPAQNSMSLGLELNPSYVDRNAHAQGQVAESACASGDTGIRSESERDEVEKVHRSATCSAAERAAQPHLVGSHESSFGDASVVV
ncbi:unnamed protein product [Peniophora sp. CBMAI 1063]|nr:unnamed protein product [Peniophora sp. CBMAI 1063]